jgi:hypothetical protein
MENTIPKLIVADEIAPFENFSKQGHYVVGNKIFNFKFNALVESNRTNLPVTWHFCNDVFDKLNWRERSQVSLSELYRIRAQQLRDKYDYLVLGFSGGADSTQMLKSFLNNNILVDEIVVDWSIKHVDRVLSVSTDTDPGNYHSEWALTIQPMLQWVSNNYPLIKITVTDSTEFLTVEDSEDTPMVMNGLSAYQSVKRYRRIRDRIYELSDRHDRVGLVMGIDKPQLFMEKNILCAQFCDFLAWIKPTHNNNRKFNLDYFYWTPEMPEIIKEQSHVVLQYLRASPNLTFLFEPKKVQIHMDAAMNLQMRQLQSEKRNLTSQLLYPDWDSTTFQTDKPESQHHNPQYQWLAMAGNTREIQSWLSAVCHIRSQVGEKSLQYFAGTSIPIDYVKFFSRLYPIGRVTKV